MTPSRCFKVFADRLACGLIINFFASGALCKSETSHFVPGAEMSSQ